MRRCISTTVSINTFKYFQLFALVCIVTLQLFPMGSLAAERAFEVLPPNKLDFNYPPHPKEGRANYFPIAVDGKARCVIVRPDKASNKAIAGVAAFTKYLQLATGGTFKVISDRTPVPKGFSSIHVGDTVVGLKVALVLPDLKYGDRKIRNVRGYLIKTLNPRTLIIRGHTETATNHAMVGFLKRYVGVRQYWPGEPGGPGDVIPHQHNLSIPQLEWRDWPYFISFQMSMKPFGPRRPQLDFYRRHATLPPGENYDDWLPPSRYVKKHPEYYALVNEKRLTPRDSDGAKGWQPCVSNREVQKHMGEAVLRYFRENPLALGINFSINDGGGDCTCSACRALDAPAADYGRNLGLSDRYVYLSNRVCEMLKKKYPDKWLVYLAYAAAAPAPSKVKPHSMLLPVLTVPNTFQRWDEWVKAGADHLGIYAHHNDTVAVLPKMDVYQHARRILYVVGSGKARTFYMEAHTQWPFADVVPYVTSELLWDPRQDVEKLMEEYFVNFYGKGAEAMREYYSILQQGYQRWLKEEGTSHWYGKDMSSYHQNKVLEQYRVLSPQEAKLASAALNKALRGAKDDKEIFQRIQIVSAAFTLQHLALERAWAAFRLRDEQPRSTQEAEQFIRDIRLIYERSKQARQHIENILEQPPLDHWRLFRSSTKPLKRYEELRSGIPNGEIRSTVSIGLHSTEEFIRNKLGANGAAAWWRALRKVEKVPALVAAFEAAETRALSPKRENLISDPGFERLGKKLSPKSNSTVLNKDQVKEVGIHLTFPDRTPYRCVLTPDVAHSGQYSLMMEHCSRARFTRHLSVKPGTRYRLGLWFRHSKGAARRYTFAVDVRLKGSTYRRLTTLHLPDQPNTWRQYISEVVAPPGATTLFLRLLAENQASDARCWIDDVFIDK